MGCDNGEREFKNSIRKINSSFKILKSEMNLGVATFKGNASSMNNLTSKSGILKRKMQSQKKKLRF